MSFCIPIYKIRVGEQLQFCAYLKPMFINISNPERDKLFAKVNQILNLKMHDPEYSVDALKLMYVHYSDSQYYVWNRETQVTFEQSLPTPLAETMLASLPHFIVAVEKTSDSPDIFWEYS